MAKPGRKQLDPEKRRAAPVPVRFTQEERAIIEAAAEADGVTSLSSWIRDRSIAAAKRRRPRP